MNQIIKTTLFGRKKSNIIGISLAMIGLYLGLLIWYVIANYLKQTAQTGLALASCISLFINTFEGFYQIPDKLCTSKKIKDLLLFPFKTEKIIFVVLIRLFFIQVFICMFFILPCIYFFHNITFLLFRTLLFCILGICCIDLYIFILFVFISSIITVKVSRYIIIFLQYSSFIFITWLGASLILTATTHPALLDSIYTIIATDYGAFVSMLFCFIIIGLWITLKLSKKRYVISYYKLHTFTKSTQQHTNILPIFENPYFLNEWCRIVRNKELIFYSTIKNIITVYALGHLLMHGFEQIGLEVQQFMDIFLVVSCCAINTISSTAYSSDKNTAFYHIFPIDWNKIFQTKVLMGTVWNEILVIIIWIIKVITSNTFYTDYIWLLIYGTVTNYICSFLGVYLDCKMPRTVNSTNELLHGNISKVMVLLLIIFITLFELFIIQTFSSWDIGISITLLNIIISVLLSISLITSKGDLYYDRNK